MTNETTTDTNLETMDIGQTLINARESQDISLATASMQTNLSHTILTKLENNQFDEIGAPVFTRGYLNSYARYLGLNEVEISEAFNRIGYDKPVDIRLTPANIASQQKSFKRNHIVKWLLLVPLFILTAVILMQIMDSNSWLMQQVKKAFPNNSTTTSDLIDAQTNDIVLEIEDTNGNVGGALSGNGAENQNIPALTSLENSESTNLQESNAIDITLDSLDESLDENVVSQDNGLGAQSSVPNGLAGEEPKLSAQNSQQSLQNIDQTTNQEITTAAQETAPVASGLLTITGENWVEVKNSNGRIVASKVFKNGETIALPAEGAPYSLNVGRPNSIQLTINGQQKDLSGYSTNGSARLFKVEIE